MLITKILGVFIANSRHFIDIGGVDFIEPLDISTLFGNSIDNAIEASEKLPENQRVIAVKAGRVNDFISILIENNCVEKQAAEESRSELLADPATWSYKLRGFPVSVIFYIRGKPIFHQSGGTGGRRGSDKGGM